MWCFWLHRQEEHYWQVTYYVSNLQILVFSYQARLRVLSYQNMALVRLIVAFQFLSARMGALGCVLSYLDTAQVRPCKLWHSISEAVQT